MKLLLAILLFFPFVASAAVQAVLMGPNAYSVNLEQTDFGVFTKVEAKGLQMTKSLGAPELPVKSFLVKATPAEVQIDLTPSVSKEYKNVKLMPVQAEPCRCPQDKERKFAFNMMAYSSSSEAYKVEYLGAFRGQPISRVDIYMGAYNLEERNQLVLYSDVRLNMNVDIYEFTSADYKEYLLLGNADLLAGADEFIQWKESQGYTVFTREILTPENNLASIRTILEDYYSNKGVDFVIFLGDANALPMHSVRTSDGATPSDLPYLTMDGADDYIPDMFASRIVADTAADVRLRLSKPIETERRTMKNKDGFRKVIGVASNEGSNPSDDEYVRSIGEAFETLGYKSTHLHQDDTKSTPEHLNNAFNDGAMWMTYMGHGSGTSWPSMNKTYETSDIADMRNVPSVKPIIIDVACMNGRLLPSYLGASIDALLGDSAGASAYYGGSVNISWHPPAIMARGISFEHVAKNFKHLGEALLAGQLYLASNYSSSAAVIDNMEWYHLQGDPGMNIQH